MSKICQTATPPRQDRFGCAGLRGCTPGYCRSGEWFAYASAAIAVTHAGLLGVIGAAFLIHETVALATGAKLIAGGESEHEVLFLARRLGALYCCRRCQPLAASTVTDDLKNCIAIAQRGLVGAGR